jgi:hypothetical protein
MSYGLLQVLGSNIRALCGIDCECPGGPTVEFDKWALDPAVGLWLGIRHLERECFRRNGDVAKALAIYNAGPRGGLIVDGKLRNQAYVDKVAAWCLRVQADRGTT